MIKTDWRTTAELIHALGHLLSALIVLLLVIWYRPSSERNLKLITRKLQNSRESLADSVEQNKEK